MPHRSTTPGLRESRPHAVLQQLWFIRTCVHPHASHTVMPSCCPTTAWWCKGLQACAADIPCPSHTKGSACMRASKPPHWDGLTCCPTLCYLLCQMGLLQSGDKQSHDTEPTSCTTVTLHCSRHGSTLQRCLRPVLHPCLSQSLFWHKLQLQLAGAGILTTLLAA